MKKFQFTLGMALLLAATSFNASAQGPWGTKAGKQYKGQVVFANVGAGFYGHNLKEDLIKKKMTVGTHVSLIAYFNSPIKSLKLEQPVLSWAIWVDAKRVNNTVDFGRVGTRTERAYLGMEMLPSTRDYSFTSKKYMRDVTRQNPDRIVLQDIIPFLESGKTHMIKVAVIKREYFNKENIPDDAIFSTGEFQLFCDPAKLEELLKKDATGRDDAIVKLHQANASMPEVEKKIVRQFEEYGNSQVTVRVVDFKWEITRHTNGGQILYKSIHVGVSYKDQNGQCKVEYSKVKLDFDEPKNEYVSIDQLIYVGLTATNHWARHKPKGKTDCSNIK